MRSLILSAVTAFSLVACGQAQETGNATESGQATAVVKASISAEQAEAKMQELEVLILDVRTPNEFEAGHIEGAINLNVLEGGFEEKVAKLNKEQAVVVYCRSGGRSAKAQNIMANQGFTETYNMEGGIMAWQAKGKNVVR